MKNYDKKTINEKSQKDNKKIESTVDIYKKQTSTAEAIRRAGLPPKD